MCYYVMDKVCVSIVTALMTQSFYESRIKSAEMCRNLRFILVSL